MFLLNCSFPGEVKALGAHRDHKGICWELKPPGVLLATQSFSQILIHISKLKKSKDVLKTPEKTNKQTKQNLCYLGWPSSKIAVTNAE